MDELISIIINVYNGEKYIQKCIQSVVNQTYTNIEIIVINDGSTDNTLNLCKEFNDSRIKIINQENKGLSFSRNVGIDNSNGKYLYFLDADDFIENDVIEYLYNLIKQYNVLIATCDSLDVYNYEFEIKKKKEKINLISDKQMIKDILLSKNRVGAIWNKLIDKTLFNNIRFEDRTINDVVVVYKLVLLANKLVVSNKIKYFYLRHYDSITGNNKEDRLKDLYKGSVDRYDYIKKIYPSFIENEIGLCLIIIYVYTQNQNIFRDIIIEEYKKIYSIKFLISKISIKNKMKLLLFRISPSIYNLLYKRIKCKFKYKKG